MVENTGFEPVTSCLQSKCAPVAPIPHGAGEGNRTPIFCLEGRSPNLWTTPAFWHFHIVEFFDIGLWSTLKSNITSENMCQTAYIFIIYFYTILSNKQTLFLMFISMVWSQFISPCQRLRIGLCWTKIIRDIFIFSRLVLACYGVIWRTYRGRSFEIIEDDEIGKIIL